jgi:hypothetical protein
MNINKNTGLILLVISSVFTLFLGTMGFYSYEPAQGGATAFYRAIQLFSLNSGVINEPPTPWLIEIARWCGTATLLGVVGATASAVYQIFKKSIHIGRMRGHMIVCGAGQRGSQIVKHLLKADALRGVVVVEIDESNQNLGELRDLGAEVIIGNALDSTVLNQAGIERAAKLVAVTHKDEMNLGICSEVENKFGRGCELHAGVESFELRSFFIDRLIDSGIRLDSFITKAARQLMLEIACEATKSTAFRENGVRVLIDATGAYQQELIRAGAIMLQISADKKPRFELCSAGEAREAVFNERFPAANLVADLAWHEDTADRAFSESGEECPDFAVFALGDDTATLEAADRFRMRHNIPASRIFSCLSNTTELFELVAKSHPQKAHEIPLKESEVIGIRNWISLGLGKKDPLELDIDKVAKQCHAIYCQKEAEKTAKEGKKCDDMPKDWASLGERLRESNRLLALHNKVKKTAWEHKTKGQEYEMLAHLSRSEHMRWMAEKAMDGWRWSGSNDKKSRIDERLLHHLLVPYDDLTDYAKDKDYNTFLWALDLSEGARALSKPSDLENKIKR